MKAWIDYTQFRDNCDDCGERHMVAVIRRGRFGDVRICRDCFPLRHWTKPEWHDARHYRIRTAQLEMHLAKAVEERDRARDLACAMVSQPPTTFERGPIGVIFSGRPFV